MMQTFDVAPECIHCRARIACMFNLFDDMNVVTTMLIIFSDLFVHFFPFTSHCRAEWLIQIR